MSSYTFRREEWEVDYSYLDQKELDKQKKQREEVQSDREDWYKNYAHQKKKFK